MEKIGNPFAGFLGSVLLVLGVAGWIAFSDTQEFPGPWLNDSKVSVIQVITENFIQDCAEFYYRRRRGSSNAHADYLVRCTADGVTWHDYLVFPDTNSALPTKDYGNLAIPR